MAAVAVQLDRLVRAAADHDFLAWVIAEAADGQPLIAVRLEPPAAGGVEVPGDRPQGPRPSTSSVATAPRPGGVNKTTLGSLFWGMSIS